MDPSNLMAAAIILFVVSASLKLFSPYLPYYSILQKCRRCFPGVILVTAAYEGLKCFVFRWCQGSTCLLVVKQFSNIPELAIMIVTFSRTLPAFDVPIC